MTIETEQSSADLSVEQWTLKPSPRKSFASMADQSVHDEANDVSTSRSSTASSDHRISASLAALTPKKLVNGILRMPDTPGTGQSVRFGKRLYDDGDESRMSDSASSIKLQRDAQLQGHESSSEERDPNQSIDLVEMSIQSIPRIEEDVDHATEDTLAQLPSVGDYSDLLDEGASLDESLLRSEVENVKGGMSTYGEAHTPRTSYTDASRYESAQSASASTRVAPSEDLSWSTPHSQPAGATVDDVDGRDDKQFSAISIESPSVARASRTDVSASYNQSSFILLPGAFASKELPRSLDEYATPSRPDKILDEPTTLPNLSTSSSDSSLEELLRATQELDQAHFERTEALRKRVQEAEEELQHLRKQGKAEQQARELAAKELHDSQHAIDRLREESRQKDMRHDERMAQVDELVSKLKKQLDSRKEDDAQSKSALADEQQIDAIRAEIREEVERDFELEKYSIQRQHDQEINKLNLRLTQTTAEQIDEFGVSKMKVDSFDDTKIQADYWQHRCVELEDEMGAYKDRVIEMEDLAKRSDELRAELQAQWRRSEEARERELELHSKVHDFEEAMERQHTELETCRDALQANEKASIELQSRVAEERRSQKVELDALQKKQQETGEILSQTQQCLDEARTQARLTQSGWEHEKDVIRSDFEQAQAQIAAAHTDEIQSLAAAKLAAEEALSALKLRLEEESHVNKALQQRNAHFEAQIGSLKQSLLVAQARITDLQLEGSTTSKGIESVKRDLLEAQNSNSSLKSVVSTLEAEIDSLVEQMNRVVVKKRETEEKCVVLQDEVLCITTKLQAEMKKRSPKTDDDSKGAQKVALKRIGELEKENSNRGITIAKLEKAKQRLEEDNFNFGIALAAKQQELSIIKRKAGAKARRSSQVVDATTTTVVANKNALQDLSNALLRAEAEENDDTLPALQRGPAHLKATRRKTIDGKAVGSKEREMEEDVRETHTSPASKAMPPPSFVSRSSDVQQTGTLASFGSRKPSVTSNRTSLASSITASHGPMELSELFPTHEPFNRGEHLSASRSRASHRAHEDGREKLEAISAPTHRLSTVNRTRMHESQSRRVLA